MGCESMILGKVPTPLIFLPVPTGAISFWNAEERHAEEDSKTHRSPISSLNWNQSGDRLFTTDENAKVQPEIEIPNPR